MPKISDPHWRIASAQKQGDRALAQIIYKWSLGSPKHGAKYKPTEAVEIRGWAIGHPDKHTMLHLVIQAQAHTFSYPLNVARPDVLKTILKSDTTERDELVCGFSRWLPAKDFEDGVNIGFETEGIIHPAARISLASGPQAQA